MGGGGPVPSPPKSKLAATEVQRNQQTEEILDSVLPPKEWSEEGQLWVQRVSSTPATRLDVINLQVTYCMYTSMCVCMLCVVWAAVIVYRSSWTLVCNSGKHGRRESALFAESSTHSALVSIPLAVHAKLYGRLCLSTVQMRLFVKSPSTVQREGYCCSGLLYPQLLLGTYITVHKMNVYRVRDEIRMTIAAYQTLYESSIAFGMRKALMAEQGKVDLQQRIEQLEAENRSLEHQVHALATSTLTAVYIPFTSVV